MAYKPSEACLDAASKAAKGLLSPADLDAAFQEAAALKEKLAASGNVDGMADRLRTAAADQAERTKIAAALARRKVALNALVRDRLETSKEALKKAGLSPLKTLLALMEGSPQGVEGARDSVAALKLAYEARYVGGMMGEIQRDRSHLVNALSDVRLSDDVMREMVELREGGSPGKTGNQDAQYLAKLFSTYAEMSRRELNRLGASIGKLDGWAGAQVHDDIKLIQAGKDEWINTIGPLLDYTRTFPDATSAAEVRHILGDIYDTIITGISNKKSAAEIGQRVNPANLAKSLGKSRVLHFRDAETAIAYRNRFGYGNTITGMFAHQRRAASIAAQMDKFGDNPEVMFEATIEAERRKINDSSMEPKQKAELLAGLKTDGARLRGAFDVMSGLANRPVSVGGAKLGQNIRAAQSMAKLGGAVFTAMPTDVASAAAASMFRGGGFWNGMVTQIGGVLRGRPKGEQAEISYLFGEGFDGLIGEVMNHGLANDGGGMGKASWLMEKYFKFNRLTWWTDVGRSVTGRNVAAEMGMRAKTAYSALPANYRHVLGLHGITETHWDAIRQAAWREVNGSTYITPDALRALPDAAVEPLVAGRLAAIAPKPSKANLSPSTIRAAELKTAAGGDMGKASDYLASQTKTALAAGRKVGLIIEGKTHNITAVERGMMKDDQGQRWGSMQILSPKPGDDARLELGGAAKTPIITPAQQAKFDARRAEILDDGRRELELAALRFVADETNYAIIEPDAASQRWATANGTRPGTIAGEATRMIMQFKGFPIAFAQRVIGRALFGHAGATKGQRALAGLPHLGAIMAGMTVAGYMSITMKDAAKGYWPPRDPTKSPKEALKVLAASMTQGGALGIYGDFLFGQQNRFGSGALETFSGPAIGTGSDLWNMYAKARDGDPKAADYLNLVLQNTPFVNLFYVRPALDLLFINSMREGLAPGTLHRQDARRLKEYGQHSLIHH